MKKKYKIVKVGNRELKVPYATKAELTELSDDFKLFKTNKRAYYKKYPVGG
jgi:hypothetical protein